MSQATLEICYVCNDYVNLDVDKFWGEDFEDGKKFRHLWHGAPGITRAVGGGGGFNGYALTIPDAKRRAEYYLHNNPYAAPEVKGIELEILEEIQRMERVSSIIGFMERNVLTEEAKDARVASMINVDYLD